jgi:hypothetical protein
VNKFSLARALVTIVVSVVVICVFTVGFVQHAIDSNNQKFCTVLYTLTGAPAADPSLQPTTPYGKQLRDYNLQVGRDLVDLERQYKCEKMKEQ